MLLTLVVLLVFEPFLSSFLSILVVNTWWGHPVSEILKFLNAIIYHYPACILLTPACKLDPPFATLLHSKNSIHIEGSLLSWALTNLGSSRMLRTFCIRSFKIVLFYCSTNNYMGSGRSGLFASLLLSNLHRFWCDFCTCNAQFELSLWGKFNALDGFARRQSNLHDLGHLGPLHTVTKGHDYEF